MPQDVYRFLLRLPQPLRKRLVEAAERSGRSLNAELVARLERSLDPWAPVRRRASLCQAPRIRIAAVALGAAIWLGGAFAVGFGAPGLIAGEQPGRHASRCTLAFPLPEGLPSVEKRNVTLCASAASGAGDSPRAPR